MTAKFIPRVVNNNDSQKIGLNYPETSPIAKKINSDTWGLRYDKMRSMDGLNAGRKLIKCQSIQAWIDAIKLPENNISMFIEGQYLYNCINRQGLFLNFEKLKLSPVIQEPINFFSVYPPNNNAVHKLYKILERCNYFLETKQDAAEGNFTVSIMPEMIVRIMSQVHDATPAVTNVLLIAQNYDLIPVIEYLRKKGITTTLAIARTQPVQNYYAGQFDHIIDMVELVKYMDVIESRRPTPANTVKE
jgi:uncharacterized LabA/DUF88 family protein